MEQTLPNPIVLQYSTDEASERLLCRPKLSKRDKKKKNRSNPTSSFRQKSIRIMGKCEVACISSICMLSSFYIATKIAEHLVFVLLSMCFVEKCE